MAMNRVLFQPGLSMAGFMEQYGSEDKCEVVDRLALAWRLCLPGVWLRSEQLVSPRRPARSPLRSTSRCRRRCRVIRSRINGSVGTSVRASTWC